MNLSLQPRGLVTVFTLTLLLLQGCGGKDVAELKASAQQQLAAGDAKTAVIELKNAVQKDSESTELRLLLGQALLAVGDATGAEVEIVRALDNGHPGDEASLWAARVWRKLGKHELILARLGTARLNDPKAMAEVQATIADAMLAQGNPGPANMTAERALELDPAQSLAVQVRARVAMTNNDADSAVAMLRRHLDAHPQDAAGWKLLGDVSLLGMGNRGDALAAFGAAVKAQPNLLEAHEMIVTLHLLKPDIAAARAALAGAQKAAPGESRVRYFEAQLAFADGDYEKVRQLLAPLFQAAPKDVNLLRLAGAAELKLGALVQARTLLGEALALSPVIFEVRRLLAETHLRAQQPSRALDVIEPVVRPGSRDADALALAGQASLMLGRGKEASEYYARALRLRPDDAVLGASAALTRMARGEDAAGLAELRDIAAKDRGTVVDLALVSALLHQRDAAGALRAVEALEKKQPDTALAANLLGRVHLLQKNPAAARASFELALKRDPQLMPALAALGQLDVSEGRPQAARERYQKLIDVDPKNVSLRLAQADFVLRHGGEGADVTRLLEATVLADPTAEQPRRALIDHQLAEDDVKAALVAAQAAVAAQPQSVELLSRLGRVQLLSGETEQAVSSLSKVVQARPEAVDSHLQLVRAQMANRQLAQAESTLQGAIKIDADSADAQQLMVTLMMNQGRADAALKAARAVQRLMPDSAVGLMLEGDIELTRKALDAAATAYRKATQHAQPGNAPVRLHRALVLAKKGGEAAGFAESWRRSHPKDLAFVMYMGDSALAAGDLPRAEREYRSVLAALPNQALALNNLAWTLTRQGKPGAVEAARQAVQAAPGSIAMQDTLALALAGEKRFPEAIQVQRELLDRNPQAHAYRMSLARILLASGARKEGISELETLERLGEVFGAHEEVKRLLVQARSS